MNYLWSFIIIVSGEDILMCLALNKADNNIAFGSYNEVVEQSQYFAKYDFVIVGSGPGGCALANRLSENPNWNVLLIEAGDVEKPLYNVAAMTPFLTLTKYNWGFKSEPETSACFGRKENRCANNHGKALGGSSVINYLMHMRGNKKDFDRWSEAGNYGWSYDEVLPYFMKSEKASLGVHSSSKYHNLDGPLSVSFNNFRTPLAKVFIEASKTMGMKEIDYNGAEQLGVGYLQANLMHGRRHTAYRAFLEPILKRKNLHIMINTNVIKILINNTTKSAYGVEFMRNNKKYRVSAEKEIVLSSGVFHSPQLLILSGIGMKEDVGRIKIPLIKQLPVGRNMHDHIAFFELNFFTDQPRNLLNIILSTFQFIDGKGILAFAGAEAMSFLKIPTNTSRGPNVPDIEIVFTPITPEFDRGLTMIRTLNMRQNIYDQVYKPLEGHVNHTFTMSVILFHPKSIGHVEISSANHFDSPKIHHNFFRESDDDVEAILQGIKYVLKLAQTEPFRMIGTRLHSIPIPYCAHILFGTDDYWRCCIKFMAFSIQHPGGTNKMGPESDPTAVVSPELKVHGINKLRVVDCSVIPEAPTAHPNAISVMIGERAADLIKNDWRRV